MDPDRRAVPSFRAPPKMTSLLRQGLRFGTVGLLNTASGLATIFALMFFAGANAIVANVVGYAVGFASGYILNRHWTFSSAGQTDGQLLRYVAVAFIAYMMNLGAVVGVALYLSFDPYLAQLAGVSVYAGVMFVGCRYFVFASSGLGPQE